MKAEKIAIRWTLQTKCVGGGGITLLKNTLSGFAARLYPQNVDAMYKFKNGHNSAM